ncbi:hypothetical protein JN531_016175 [Flagellatimonas centrodinii]|uniref:hypothetical protein n=1 Tax=Flagellatimonas centrodinii TaxID=2806210 RepID=UPI001FEF38D4|nr:hypothetical protein [Flagellatimonas centrodinii]ULQ46620.1 hypothetical protein JN531_016175 [Flagellatimonas centrodinii]
MALIIGACVVAAYFRGLFGEFLFDDFHNIVENPAIQTIDGSVDSWLAASLSSTAGKLRRPVSMASFAANHLLFGMHPFPFKVVNLVLHLLCGLLIYRLSCHLVPRLLGGGIKPQRASIDPRGISLLITAIWLLHPLSVSSVLYVVQRMNLLSTLFILLGLLCYTTGRIRALNGQSGLLLALTLTTLCAVLAVFSKENGLLIFPYLFVLEWVCFRFSGLGRTDKNLLMLYLGVFLLLPVTLVAIYLFQNPDWITARYERRDFTLIERLLTQPRILSHYLLWIFAPLPQWMGIYHDDIPGSTALLSPWTTLPAILLLGGALITAILLRQRSPAFALGVLWFAVGHSMESTFIALENVFEHRNYAPMIGLIIGTVVITSKMLANRSGKTKIGVATAVIALLAATTFYRATLWGDPVRMALVAAEQHPDSARSQYDAGRLVYIEAMAEGSEPLGVQRAKPYLERAMALSPNYVNPVVSLILTQYKGKPIPDDIFIELINRIGRNKALKPNAVFLIQNAATDARIEMSPAQVRALFVAAMDNPSVRFGVRAQLLNNYGRYHYVRLNAPQEAISLTLAAAETDPRNPIYQINLAKLALALEQPSIATQHLERARRLDIASIYRDQIATIATQINNSNKVE